MENNRRIFSRNDATAPICLSIKDTGDHFDSMMVDYSPGGIGVKTDRPIELHQEVCVMMHPCQSDNFRQQSRCLYNGKICWCQLMGDQEENHFALGLQFIEADSKLYEEGFILLQGTCDLCGVLMPQSMVRQINDSASLCPDCYKHFQQQSAGPLKECMFRFMLKNVI